LIEPRVSPDRKETKPSVDLSGGSDVARGCEVPGHAGVEVGMVEVRWLGQEPMRAIERGRARITDGNAGTFENAWA
jgi:hypothetical protein